LGFSFSGLWGFSGHTQRSFKARLRFLLVVLFRFFRHA
jgi:hypothetical protein